MIIVPTNSGLIPEEWLKTLQILKIKIIQESWGLIKDDNDLNEEWMIKKELENKISIWINDINLLNGEIEDFNQNLKTDLLKLNGN